MKKLILMAMIAFSAKASMAQTGEALAFTKVGNLKVRLDSISGDYNTCGCFVLDTMFSVENKNTGTVSKPKYVATAGWGAWGAKTTTSVAGWEVVGKIINLRANSCYYLPGIVHLDSGITMNVPAGTKFYGSNLSPSAFVVLPKAMLNVKGTAALPVIMTSALEPSKRNRGDWGGLVIAGRAPIAGFASGTTATGNLSPMEGLKDLPSNDKKGKNIYLAGGTDELSNSGSIQFLQVNYAGFNVGAGGSGNELNGISLYGVGNKTIMKNIQITEANDDAIEFFGGSVNVSNLLIINTLDDDIDMDNGYKGVVQNVVVMRLDTAAHDISGSKLVEASCRNVNHPRQTNGIITNMTAFGPRSFLGKNFSYSKDSFAVYNYVTKTWGKVKAAGRNYYRGVEINTGAKIQVLNSIIHGYDQALNIVDATTASRIDSAYNGLMFAYNTINNCTNPISTLSNLTSATLNAFGSTTKLERSSALNWLKYDQQFNNILASDAIQAQGYNITFTKNATPALSSIAFYSLYGKDYPATNKALQTLGTSWSPRVNGKCVTLLDSHVVLKNAVRIDNRGAKAFWTAGGFDIDPTGDYCSGSGAFVRPLDSDNGATLETVKPEFHVENPTSSDVINIGFDNVKTDKMTVNVYDLSGKKVASKKMNLDNTSGNVEMDATNLTNGVYIVETNCGGVVSSSKVILNK